MTRSRLHRRTDHASAAVQAESQRLLPLFLRWVGPRGTKEMLAQAGLPYGHAVAWLGGRVALRQEWQVVVRAILGDTGGAP